MQSLSELKQGMGELWGSVSEGWRHLRQSMSGALTRFVTARRTTISICLFQLGAIGGGRVRGRPKNCRAARGARR